MRTLVPNREIEDLDGFLIWEINFPWLSICRKLKCLVKQTWYSRRFQVEVYGSHTNFLYGNRTVSLEIYSNSNLLVKQPPLDGVFILFMTTWSRLYLMEQFHFHIKVKHKLILQFISIHFQIRHRFGLYDEITFSNGRKTRHCNWVRFLKVVESYGPQVIKAESAT